MAINSVDMDKALSSATYAQQLLRSGNVSAEQKGQLSAKWGAEKVSKWLSVDSTEYQIEDEEFDTAKANGKAAAKDATGYDGGKTYRSVVDAAESAGAAVVGYTVGGNLAGSAAVKMGLGKSVSVSSKTLKSGGGNLSDVATAILTSAVAAKYYIAKPNKDQHEAGEVLYESELPQAQSALNEAQSNIEDASEEVTELTEEAEVLNEDANEKIEEDKTLFDFYRQQYEALKAKAEAGEALTPDEKELMKQLAPLMEGLGEDIDETSEGTSDEVNGLYETIGEYQDTFDESAETIAEVEGVTDFAEGFDENTRTMMYVEAGAQTVNATTAGIAAAKLWAKSGLTFGATSAFAVMATAASIASVGATTQQMSWASDMTQEIHARRDTQDLGSMTNDMYGEELDNYAGNMETVEDLEMEIPDDIEAPKDSPSAPVSGDTGNNGGITGTVKGSKNDSGTDAKNDDNKKKDDQNI